MPRNIEEMTKLAEKYVETHGGNYSLLSILQARRPQNFPSASKQPHTAVGEPPKTIGTQRQEAQLPGTHQDLTVSTAVARVI